MAKKWWCFGGIAAFVVAALVVWFWIGAPTGKSATVAPVKVFYGSGSIRGTKMLVLKNRYDGFVAKVCCRNYQEVKSGDVIIEYDDYDIRTKMEAKRNAVTEQEKLVEEKKLKLAKVRLDPLPSNYRNINYKQMAAEEKLKRLRHELGVYTKLHRNNIISELALREKMQDCKDAEADVQSNAHDISVVNQGLAENYIAIAEKELESATVKLADLRREMALLEEGAQYYRITAPFDGVVILHVEQSGTWNPAGTAAAELHSLKGREVECVVEKAASRYLVLGRQYFWRSNQYDCDAKGCALVSPLSIRKHGGEGAVIVRCRIDSAPEELKINSTGMLEIEAIGR